MGLETNVTNIQDLNQQWPPVGDPRAQGADHLRNIKKAVQLTFPNLKQCLLSDAQFTALGTLIGDGSGTFTINGKLTVSDTLTVTGNLLAPIVTDWTTQQAVGAKDAEGRYLKPGDADGRYVAKADGGNDYPALSAGVQKATGNPWLSYNDGSGVKFAIAQQAGDYATNTALNALSGSCLANNNPGIPGALAGTSLCVNPANGLPYLAYDGNTKIFALALDDAKVNCSGDTMHGTLTIEGATSGFVAQYSPGSPSAGTFINYPGLISIAEGRGGEFYCQLQEEVGSRFSGLFSLKGSNGNWRYVGIPEGLRINDSQYGDVAYVNDLPFTDKSLRVQVWVKDGVTTNDWVGLPQGFSSLLGVIAQDITPWSRYSSINPVVADSDTFQGGQFQVRIWSGGTNRKILFTAFGHF